MSSSKLLPTHLTADLRIPALLASLLVSAWVAWTTDVINQDAILYLSAARLVMAGDWAVACGYPELQCWLFYPALIALVSKITSLNLELSAYGLDALFSCLMVYVFLTIARELGANGRTIWFAAFVILLHPYLNESRADILRDHGYWLFYLAAILFFIRYCHQPGWRLAFAWLSAAVIATLFRIEGVVFLLLLPLVLMLDSAKAISERILALLKLNALPAALAIFLIGWSLLDPTFAEQTGRLLEPVARINETWMQLDTGLDAKAAVIGDKVLGSSLDHYAKNSLWVMLGLIILTKIVTILTPVYALLLPFKRFRGHFNPPPIVGKLFVWLIFVNLGVLFVELITRFFFSGRFVVPLVLVLMLVVPFTLEALYEQWKLRNSFPLQKWLLFPLVVGALFYNSVDGLYSTGKGSKSYLREAGDWLDQRATPATKLFSNDDRVTYYSGQKINWTDRASTIRTNQAFNRGDWPKYDFVAIHVDSDDNAFRKKIMKSLGVPVVTFSNDKQDSVLIFSRGTAKLLPKS